jgi:adenylylsulfate kinase
VALRFEQDSAEQAFAVWITGLPASGKSTIAGALKTLLTERGVDVEVLESDIMRKLFSENPRYGASDRADFYQRMIWVGVLLTRHGVPVIFDATANRRAWRDEARKQIPKFAEVYVDVPLKTCIERDPKGIYRSAAEGRASDVPGMQAAYEPPENPDLVIDGTREAPLDAARRIIVLLKEKRYWP